jgi:molecular chaperone HscC
MGDFLIVGIDLGTTNSAIAVWRDGKAQLIPNSLGHNLTPSAVGLDDTGELLVGLAARDRQSTHPALTATIFKRYMGSQRAIPLGDKTYMPEELSAMVLRSLKADAEAWLGAPVTEAVITVPAYFNDKQRKATRHAGELAGLKVERLLNEPTAAALAYGIHNLGNEARFLVFDLGGGTFDVSILEIFEGVIEVRASTGDNRLGGEDFNDLLVRAMRWKFRDSLSASTEDDDALTQILRAAAERTRRALTTQSPAPMSIVWNGTPFSFDVTTEDFEALAAPLVERLKEPILNAIRDSKLRTEDLNEIVLVGGATRMPLIRRVVTRLFDRFPSHAVHPDEAVALGAAVQAGLKARDAALREVAVTDVCPYSLGVEIAERLPDGGARPGVFAPVIERNVVVPASRQKTFFTTSPGQVQVLLNIYQGESRSVRDNINLGQVTIPVPPQRAGPVAVECRFTYDINGLIEVDVHVPLTGEKRQLTIVDADGPTGADLEERRAALAALKIHPRERDVNRAVLARANRCYETFLGDKREQVSTWIRAFEDVIDGQDPRAIERLRTDFIRVLDTLDGETYL